MTQAQTDRLTILAADHISKSFTSPDGGPLVVLDDINFELHDGEIVALLGKSGSGKSTLLRCLAGLIAPTDGHALYKNAPVTAANPGVAMVFQTFALLPWLTVRQNVELGLEARNVPARERRDRAERAIDLIGLDGFESAYPKELSGGMRQRVGFARALVVEPDALFMDEPFSALDVLTAENLRTELLTLWAAPWLPDAGDADRHAQHRRGGAARGSRACALVEPRPDPRRAHGRAPAAARPARAAVRGADRRDLQHHDGPGGGARAHAVAPVTPAQPSPIDQPLPAATVGGMAGLLEILLARGGDEDLPALAHDLMFEVDDLLPLVDGASLLGFATVDRADIQITDDGREFVVADILTTKKLFAHKAAERAPLVRAINNALAASIDGNLPEGFFLDILRRGFSDEEARHQLDIAIDWGRYSELYDYDANTGQLRSEPNTVDNEADPVEA